MAYNVNNEVITWVWMAGYFKNLIWLIIHGYRTYKLIVRIRCMKLKLLRGLRWDHVRQLHIGIRMFRKKWNPVWCPNDFWVKTRVHIFLSLKRWEKQRFWLFAVNIVKIYVLPNKSKSVDAIWARFTEILDVYMQIEPQSDFKQRRGGPL